MKTKFVNLSRIGAVHVQTSIFFIISLILLSLVVLIRYFIVQESIYSNSGFYPVYLDQYSIPCENVSLSPDEDFNLFTTNKHTFTPFVEKNIYFCKFFNLTDLITKFVERIERQRLALGKVGKPYLQCGNKSLQPVSGHLTATFTRISKRSHRQVNESYEEQQLHWDTESNNSFISNSLHYHKGKIRVPEGRYYFVYATVYLNLSRLTKENSIHTWIRICTGTTRERERTILYHSKYFSLRNSVTSLSVQGVVFLPKREHIFVKMSNSQLMISQSAGNVFGIYPFN